MGYYTRFEVEFAPQPVETADWDAPFLPGQDPKVDYIAKLNEVLGETLFDSDGSDAYGGDIKWYSWESDMLEASKKIPNILITLSGHGEDREDIWRAYFLNGQVQSERAVIQLAPFDPKKLKPYTHMPNR